VNIHFDDFTGKPQSTSDICVQKENIQNIYLYHQHQYQHSLLEITILHKLEFIHTTINMWHTLLYVELLCTYFLIFGMMIASLQEASTLKPR
ncbi:hypothetical protein ACJX0J_032627, partial [Zea mays]